MCTSNELYTEIDYLEIKEKAVKKSEARFYHLYREKVFHISKTNCQTLTTGYRPHGDLRFKFYMRIDDNRYKDSLNLTLFQFVTLIKDLRYMIYDPKKIELLDKVDALLQFSFKDINVPKVTVEVDPSDPSPDYFHLNLVDSKDKQLKCIVLDKTTIQCLVESEADVINTIEGLEDRPSKFLLENFITKCVEQLKNENITFDHKKIFNKIKSMNKSPFQSEMFLKFWPLICKLIEIKLRTIPADKCEQ